MYIPIDMTVRVYPKFQSVSKVFWLEIRSISLQKHQTPYLSVNLYISLIACHSVMSSAHINLLGEYDFSDDKLQDSFGIRPPKLVS